MNILLADDSIKMRQMISRLLTEKLETLENIYECENGEQALLLYDRYSPDWTLLDIKMEPLDGLQSARAIKARNPRARIILITNYDEESYREEARKISIFAYILKEDLHQLIDILKSRN